MGRVRASHGGVSRLFASLLLPAALSLPAQQPDTPVFATDVRLVTLPVTVKDADGAPVGDLERGDFEILEAGVARRVAVFERRTNRPLSVALMLDTSLSTAIELRYERESASRFLKNLLGRGSHPGDRAAVFSFSADVQVHQRFTRDRRALERALGSMRPESGTSVYDAVRLASGELARREGRRVIVMITDGGDTTSHWRFADALRAAHGPRGRHLSADRAADPERCGQEPGRGTRPDHARQEQRRRDLRPSTELRISMWRSVRFCAICARSTSWVSIRESKVLRPRRSSVPSRSVRRRPEPWCSPGRATTRTRMRWLCDRGRLGTRPPVCARCRRRVVPARAAPKRRLRLPSRNGVSRTAGEGLRSSGRVDSSAASSRRAAKEQGLGRPVRTASFRSADSLWCDSLRRRLHPVCH